VSYQCFQPATSSNWERIESDLEQRVRKHRDEEDAATGKELKEVCRYMGRLCQIAEQQLGKN
jgi:hypothetical protein